MFKMIAGRTSAGENFQRLCPKIPDKRYKRQTNNSASVTPKLDIFVIKTPVLYSFQLAKNKAVYDEKYKRKICKFYN